MNRSSLLLPLVATVSLIALLPVAALSDDSADTVSPAQAKTILDYYRKKCELFEPQYCMPGGVDTKKNEVRVLDRDTTQREEDIKSLESQTVETMSAHPGSNYALMLHYCKPPVPPKYRVDIAVYKMFDKQVISMMNNVAESMWNICQNESRTADIKLMKKIKVIHFVLVPPSPAVENDNEYDLDAKTGVLTVKAFSDVGPPGRDSKNWKTFLRNN